jgi:hypothetical protein
MDVKYPVGSLVQTTVPEPESTESPEAASVEKADRHVLVWRNTESGEWRVHPRSLSQSELDLATEVLSLSGCADIWFTSEDE